jgi:type II secretory pathway component PulK
VLITEFIKTNEGHGSAIPRNERGVALIIVLLVTALLIALIFEFAYGTRISLRAAFNFRDSQRADYLARSGINFVGRYLASNLRTDATGSNHKYDDVERDWQTVPFIPGTDTVLKVKWEDEAAKIRVTDAQTNPLRQAMLSSLFESKGIDRAVLGRMMENTSGLNKMSLLTGLHQFMNDEDYNKVYQFLTVNPNVTNININTAPEDVLLSFGISPGAVSLINDDRKKAPITDYTNHPAIKGLLINTSLVSNFLTDKTDNFKVYSYATVGGYTKQVEAVITRTTSGFTVSYWRSL